LAEQAFLLAGQVQQEILAEQGYFQLQPQPVPPREQAMLRPEKAMSRPEKAMSN
jgi:hypothetical protein